LHRHHPAADICAGVGAVGACNGVQSWNVAGPGGRPWAVARCVRGTRNGDVLLVGAARRDVCVASLKGVSSLSNKNTFLGGASVRVVCRHERRITCVSEASTVAVATEACDGVALHAVA